VEQNPENNVMERVNGRGRGMKITNRVTPWKLDKRIEA